MKFTLANALYALSMAYKVYAAVTPCGISTYMVILLENEDQVDVIADPYFKSLAAKGYNMGNYYGIAHPSQPNYIAMVSGSTQGCTNDSNININARSVADLLESKGLTWKAYNEAYPGNCYLSSSSGKYYRKHNPLLSFTNIQTNPARCAKIVNSSQLSSDAASGNLPNYAFYTPDQNNDGHDTSIAYTSSWLQGFLEPKLSDPAYANTLFHIVFDESASTSPNQIYSVFVGKGVTTGTVDNTKYDHYSGLATVENLFGLGNLGLNDASAKVIPFGCSTGGITSSTTTTTKISTTTTTTLPPPTTSTTTTTLKPTTSTRIISVGPSSSTTTTTTVPAKSSTTTTTTNKATTSTTTTTSVKATTATGSGGITGTTCTSFGSTQCVTGTLYQCSYFGSWSLTWGPWTTC
ncbi:UNVERIFIED_CONTAM: hypothetical protein HDU68_001390 [Siphonaria sp. JEL0065]|nr:hypothetical protein HDU68_001390 [Siphonaria sp. JEL0065]